MYVCGIVCTSTPFTLQGNEPSTRTGLCRVASTCNRKGSRGEPTQIHNHITVIHCSRMKDLRTPRSQMTSDQFHLSTMHHFHAPHTHEEWLPYARAYQFVKHCRPGVPCADLLLTGLHPKQTLCQLCVLLSGAWGSSDTCDNTCSKLRNKEGNTSCICITDQWSCSDC